MSTLADQYPVPENLPPSGDTSPFLEALTATEGAREDFFVACQEYNRRPSSRHRGGIDTTVDTYATCVEDLLAAMQADTPCHKYVADCVGLIVGEDADRVNHFNSFLDEEQFTALSDKSKSEINLALATAIAKVTTPAEIKEITVTHVLDFFRGTLALDTQDFIDSVEDRKAAKLLLLRSSLGKHALDVGKMTFAVAAGILLSRAAGNPRRR